VISRYLQELVALQCLVLRPDPLPAPEETRLTSSGLAALVPLLHALVPLAALEMSAQVFQAPGLVNVLTRFLCVSPFVGASIFLISNEAYIVQFKQGIAGHSPDEIARRRKSARHFALVSVAGGLASLWFLSLAQGQRNAT